MEQFGKRQAELGKALENIIDNYKKDPKDRKTKAEYCIERARRLEEAWSRFELTDNELRSLPELPLDHPYFAKDYYNSIRTLYEQYREHFNEKIDSFDKEEQDPLQQPDKGSETQDVPLRSPPKQAMPKPFQPEGKADMAQSNLESVEINKIIRRQRGIIQSLRRVLEGVQYDDAHPRQYYKIKAETISQHWCQIENQNYSLWEMTDDPATMGYDVNEYIALEERVQNTLVQLSTRIDVAPTPNLVQHGTTLQLPRMTLPKFDGDYLKWRQFYDLFSQMVHNQPLPNCQKMWYLKTNLVGEAEKFIRHLPLSEENYTTAWKLLQDRYNNMRILVAGLINKLLGQASHASDNVSASAVKMLHDTTQECLLALENLEVSTTNWDPLLLHILVKKLDKASHTLYEQSLPNPRGLQTMKGFLSFLEGRFQSLEALGHKSKNVDEQRKINTSKSMASVAITPPACVSCKGNHQLYQCTTFLKLTPSNRLKVLRGNNLCVNCMRSGHTTVKCKSRGCTKCNKMHNTLVHLNDCEGLQSQQASTTLAPRQVACRATPPRSSFSTVDQPIDSSSSVTALSSKQNRGFVLLSTARVILTSSNGRSLECRAILDSGSQINILSQRIVKKLGLAPTSDSLVIEGIGQGKRQSHQRVNVLLQSRLNGYSTRVEAFILRSIISPQPTRQLDISSWAIPNNIKLADPAFNRPDQIDILLGAEFYHQLLSIGQIKLSEDLPILQNTMLGWIIAGRVERAPLTTAACAICTDEDLNNVIEKFWKMEEVEEPKSRLTPAESRCEVYFNQTTQRDYEGRFLVKLPFASDPTQLGESKNIALRRFLSLERRLATNNVLRQHYVGFMEEYERLGHMEEIDMEKLTTPYYFLPHHGVHKPESTSTKLRVVFDASAKTSTNLSLNDVLHAGPTIQDDLFSILLRFRMPRFVFTADIEKMYRQVLIHQDDRKYQLILWRSDPQEPLRCYQLNTVTYGTTSAPYLATKCLHELAHDGSGRLPLASKSILENCYVDDVITGSDSLNEAIQTQSQLMSLLTEGGFKLRKWCSNNSRLLKNIPPEDQAIQLDFSEEMDESLKTLGLIWLPKSDQFCVKTCCIDKSRVTKRNVASLIARLFDPLGIISPIVVTAKIFLQRLWQLKLDWDASLPMELHTRWVKFHEELLFMENIQFPRHVFGGDVPKTVQFHAFADASERAYGAAMYIRSTTSDGRILVRLICSKSRVAPIKQVTLPRLELCAAKLAAELASRAKRDLKLENSPTHFWTDSEIVLAWINSTSSSFQVFVANRIATIQGLTNTQQRRHVSSKENPADVLSRGTTPEKLKAHNLWFYGPPFLHGEEAMWPSIYNKNLQIPCELERKRASLPVATALNANNRSSNPICNIQHGNSFRRLQRITAYLIKFINKVKGSKVSPSSKDATLMVKELDSALYVLIKLMQQSEFHEEINQLRHYKEVNKRSSLSDFAPFLDENDIIRVGGRLEESNLSYDSKHPMLLPYSHPWTKLLMTDLHNENLHCGPQTLLATTRQRFWPIKGKILARSIVQHCVRCAKAKPKLLSQIMGNLPSTRVQPARPFINSGVDFCGPIFIHYRVRGKQPHKAYVAVFCCFATKAVHLEVVSDLTTEAFLAALRRFTGRRGHCKNLYCDNATNFVGARNQLHKLSETIYSDDAQAKIASSCNARGIDFHFIPPRAPHFGGLWEAAVKSAKHLLLRSVTSASLTYEELETVMVEIEAILNSRPLTPMSADPNDLTALTPGHLLIGEPLTASIDAFSEPCKASLLKRWKLVSHIKHDFWRRWSREYLNELQHRYKWKQRCQNVEPGTIVILKEENTPVTKWPLGRIVQLHKGTDGYARVADVRTVTGVFRRPIHKLAPLPIEANDAQHTLTSAEQVTKSESALKTQDDQHKETPRVTNGADPRPSTSVTANRSPRKKARTSLGSLIVSTWLVCLFLPALKGDPVEVTTFNSRPGIHFEHLGTAKLISTEWNLVTYYNLRPYRMEFNTLKRGIKTLEHLCNQIKHKSSCIPVITQFQHIQEELIVDNDLLPTQNSSIREKRGAIDIVGNIANSLFGVLDSQYAEHMAKTIEAVKGNELHLLELIKNQTSIIDSTVNIVKRGQEATNKKFMALEEQMTQIINRISDTGEETQQFKVMQLFSSLSIQMTLIASDIQRFHLSIIDALTDSHHGQISPRLLSPAQLREEVLLIQSHLPTSLSLPTSQGSILPLYKLISVEGRAVENYVIFKLMIPLINLEKFDLFKTWPIPVYVNETFISIRSCASNLTVTSHRDQHYPLTDQELAGCKSVEERVYLCKQLHPVYRRRANVCSCESDLLNGIPYTQSCNVLKIEEDSIWLQLTHENQWIYALKGTTSINVACSNVTITTSINGSGLLKLQPDCSIKHELLTLQGHYIYSSESRRSYTKLSELLNITTPEHLSAILQEKGHYHPQLKELEELQEIIKKQKFDLPTDIHTRTTHGLTIGYTGVFLVITILLGLLYKHREDMQKCLRGKPKPLPRQQQRHEDFVVNIE